MCYTVDSGYFLNKKVGRRGSEEADSDYLQAALMLGISVDCVWGAGNQQGWVYTPLPASLVNGQSGEWVISAWFTLPVCRQVVISCHRE